MNFITVKFRCDHCGLDWTEVPVRERRADEDLKLYVTHVIGGEVQAVHFARSPKCQCDQVDLMIPLPAGSKQIGQARRQ